MPNKGILYIATGDEYISEAKLSARQTKQAVDYPVTLISDREVSCSAFDTIIVDESPTYSYGDKPRNLKRSPYDKTLFIDTDIYLDTKASELFDLLAQIELAAAIDPNEWALRMTDHRPFPDVPMSLPEYNTGVLVFQDTPAVHALLEDWEEKYSDDHRQDQLAFRAALWEADLIFSVISSNYNCMFDNPLQVTGEVSVLHDFGGLFRGADLNAVESLFARVNRTHYPRLLFHKEDRIIPMPPLEDPALFRVARSIIRDGYLGTVKSVARSILSRIR